MEGSNNIEQLGNVELLENVERYGTIGHGKVGRSVGAIWHYLVDENGRLALTSGGAHV